MARKIRGTAERLNLLGIILVSYALIIALGDSRVGAAARVALFAILLWWSTRLHTERRLRRWAVALGLVTFGGVAVAALLGDARLVYGVTGVCTTVLIMLAVGSIASTLRVRGPVDLATVFGVLSVYLLLALFYAALHQSFAAVIEPYLNGTSTPPSASDLLYFSVITIATVGYGDITPVSEVARAVTVVEALTGQLYLVSVVAGVVGGLQSRREADGGPT